MINENTPTIDTGRLVLRQFVHADADTLFELLRDREVNTFLPWFPSQSLRDAEIFLAERFLAYYDKPSAYRYALCLKGDHRPIGYVCLSDDESHDFGYGLKKEFWHKGIATEAASAAVERIKRAGYAYITATHDKNNPHSGAVMKKLGMQYRYSYVEQWQPKDISVTFRLYQMNFDGDIGRTYMDYRNNHKDHFIEEPLW